MKKHIQLFAAVLISLCIALSATTVSAASKSKKEKEIITEKYSSDIDCESCVKKVMDTLPFQKGIKDVKVDLDKKVITVTYDKAKNSDEQIIASLKKVNVAAKVFKESEHTVVEQSSHEGHNH